MTIITEEKFVDLVKQAEYEANQNLKSYNIKLTLFALLGYAVILLLFLLLMGLAGGLIATALFSTGLFILLIKKKIIVAILLAMWILIKALWVRFTPPKGYILKREEAPKLFAELDSLRKELKSLKIHEVILNTSLNASVTQHPRLGVLGWQKNYLILGYRLLLTLSPEQMRSVVAHEFGHLSLNHSRFAGWIYRIRLTWERIMYAFENTQSWGAILMSKFFQWYSPKFRAYSFVLARKSEYEADTISAKLTSPSTAADALINLYTIASFLDEKYWKEYINFADELPHPPHEPYKGFSDFLQRYSIENDIVQKKLQEELSIQTHYFNTHPSLNDRLIALNVAPRLPIFSRINAAHSWLESSNEKLMHYFDKEWINENIRAWQDRYEYAHNAKEKIQQFSSKELISLSDEDLWKYAYWSHEFISVESAFELFLAFELRNPENIDATYFIGKYLLNNGDEGGIKYLSIARQSEYYIDEVWNLVYNFLIANNKQEEATEWWNECEHLNKINLLAKDERDSLKKIDTFIYPEINDALLNEVVENLIKNKKIKNAWLCEKEVKYFPEDQVYVIAYASKGIVFSEQKLQKMIADNLHVNGTFFIINKYQNLKPLFKKVKKIGRKII
ncbi:MAG: hypothetical protein KU37_02125 [Sulfuricurvum sp. PC08-66]|nr:MAG: hypothetical protein KU37_02125 [Sulfuricurvum sp. PC08-66]